jgi:hypothetical protein
VKAVFFPMVECKMWYDSLAFKKMISKSTLESRNVGVLEVCPYIW